jgi:hypothetical protein
MSIGSRSAPCNGDMGGAFLIPPLKARDPAEAIAVYAFTHLPRSLHPSQGEGRDGGELSNELASHSIAMDMPSFHERL